MKYDQLIADLRVPARWHCDTHRPVTEADLARVETALGFQLHDLLRRFYLEVANGGLFDIFSIATATFTPEPDASLLDVREQMLDPSEAAYLARAVPFVYLDYLEWIWVGQDGTLFASVENGLYRAPATLADWFRAALEGKGDDLLFELGEPRQGRNPFTGEPWVYRARNARGEKLVDPAG